jgi:hypothetical protein
LFVPGVFHSNLKWLSLMRLKLLVEEDFVKDRRNNRELAKE